MPQNAELIIKPWGAPLGALAIPSRKIKITPFNMTELQAEYSKTAELYAARVKYYLSAEFNSILRLLVHIIARRKVLNFGIPRTISFYLVPDINQNMTNGYYTYYGLNDWRVSPHKYEDIAPSVIPQYFVFNKLNPPNPVESIRDSLEQKFGSFCRFYLITLSETKSKLSKIFGLSPKKLYTICVEITTDDIIRKNDDQQEILQSKDVTIAGDPFAFD